MVKFLGADQAEHPSHSTANLCGIALYISFCAANSFIDQEKDELRSFKKADYGSLFLLGLVYYAMTQGGQFLTLKHLDAISFSLM